MEQLCPLMYPGCFFLHWKNGGKNNLNGATQKWFGYEVFLANKHDENQKNLLNLYLPNVDLVKSI